MWPLVQPVCREHTCCARPCANSLGAAGTLLHLFFLVYSASRSWVQKERILTVKKPENPEKQRSEVKVAQSCPTLCDPMDCSLPGSSVHEILQARILEWVAISFARESS